MVLGLSYYHIAFLGNPELAPTGLQGWKKTLYHIANGHVNQYNLQSFDPDI